MKLNTSGCFLTSEEIAARSDESGLHCLDESLALDSQREDSDINVIVRRFQKTGELPVIQQPPRFGDFVDGVTDYRSALDMVRAADASFMSLSAEVRARFGHDPAQFLSFVEDPANLDELVKLGLAVEKEKQDGTEGEPKAGGSRGEGREDGGRREGVSGRRGGGVEGTERDGAGARQSSLPGVGRKAGEPRDD